MNTPQKNNRVAMAMSGGVDSSVAAALLKQQGYDVVGITMQLKDSAKTQGIINNACDQCRPPDHIDDARRVADQLGIPFHVVNFTKEFQKEVINYFASEYLCGRTPNPCVKCNKWIKFGLLMDKARELGADFLATGHYAVCEQTTDGLFHLRKGADANKDQSYFLFALTQEQLAHTLFPLGGMTKPDVRKLAANFGLQVAEKSESQEICFIPDNNYARFLEDERKLPERTGNIVDGHGKVLGQHNGTYRYTIGQRKGLGIAHPTPLFVLGVDVQRNEVIVGEEAELFRDVLTASEINWIAATPTEPFEASCKIRYRHPPVACLVTPLPLGRADIRLKKAERAITPGQAVVFYNDDEVLGGGWIEGR